MRKRKLSVKGRKDYCRHEKAKSSGAGPTPEAMKMMTEAMQSMSPEEMQEVMKHMGK